ncbi:hypothetical protein CEQ90_09565 [Lewinellaceae bacterium SD302]|nr:hypothetical protein CEQ90_09565 [Lewinellaceae bacterium SD302]
MFIFARMLFSILLTIGIATLLASQTNSVAEYELQIADRLYGFEIARLATDHERLLDFVYPELFTLIPREILRDKMEGTNKVAVLVDRLEAFRLTRIGAPVEADGKTFLQVSYEYVRPATEGTPRFLRTTNDRTDLISRKILAIRTDNELQWYFLEIQHGQEELLSSIIPRAVFR